MTKRSENLNIYRHKWENRMVFVAILAIAVASIIAVILTLNNEKIPTFLEGILAVVYVLPLLTAVLIHYNYWKEAVDAVEITDTQYPELYKIFKKQVKLGGFDFMPRLYIKNGNGVLNAFASKSRFKTSKGAYIVVHSDIIDTYYDLGDKNTFKFVVSHELGHIKLGHVNIRRMVMMGALRPVLLHSTFSRAQEYSADRFGASINDDTAFSSLSLLFAGKRNYKRIDLEEYIKNDSRQISRVWVAVVNFRADHAVGRRRLAAAHQMDKDGWQNVNGRML